MVGRRQRAQTSEVRAGAGASTLLGAVGAFRPSRHEQAEPGVVRAARRARLPVPLQGTSRLPGGAHRRDQGEPAGVARRRTRVPTPLPAPRVPPLATGPSRPGLGPQVSRSQCVFGDDLALSNLRRLPRPFLSHFRISLYVSKMMTASSPFSEKETEATCLNDSNLESLGGTIQD